MELSRHNIFSSIHRSDEYFIVNILSGNADILNPTEAQRVIRNEVNDDPVFIERGYVTDPREEERSFRRKYLDFLDSRDNDEVQIFYIPSYACNFNCSYCYQEGYGGNSRDKGPAVTSAFFSYVRDYFKDRRKYITLFGGEPLLAGNRNRKFLKDFVKNCREYDLDLAVVTNGYHLESYIPDLSVARIREIQVTLDGPESIHNQRRHLKGGRGTFAAIVRGIDAALAAGFPVNLRVVLDKDNISQLPDLAGYAADRGWTKSPLFKTQLGRNYELHHCQSQQAKLYSRIDLYRDLYDLILGNPLILDFHKPAFSVSRFLFENGELPVPLFDSCPGCKTEWAFDHTGKIYSCTATVGKPGEELGTFYPGISSNFKQVEKWQQRDVLSIKACKDCNLSLACGGGCASLAYNRAKELHAPDCRPVKELLELGISLYSKFENELSRE
jgi:uncharacterized protein